LSWCLRNRLTFNKQGFRPLLLPNFSYETKDLFDKYRPQREHSSCCSEKGLHCSRNWFSDEDTWRYCSFQYPV